MGNSQAYPVYVGLWESQLKKNAKISSLSIQLRYFAGTFAKIFNQECSETKQSPKNRPSIRSCDCQLSFDCRRLKTCKHSNHALDYSRNRVFGQATPSIQKRSYHLHRSLHDRNFTSGPSTRHCHEVNFTFNQKLTSSSPRQSTEFFSFSEEHSEVTKEKLEEFKNLVFQDAIIVKDFVTCNEERTITREVEKGLARLKYQYDHWDGVIYGYREIEKSRWSSEAKTILDRIRLFAFDKRQ